MPASRTVELHDGIYGVVKPKNETKPIYFTDEDPVFVVEITNENDFDLGNDSTVQWTIGIGEGKPEPVFQGLIEIEVPAGETRTYEIGEEYLSYEGHAVIGLGAGGLTGKNSKNERTLRKPAGTMTSPSFSFSIWDREHYEVVHEIPRERQKYALYVSAAIAFFAFVQLFVAVFNVLQTLGWV